MVCGEAEVVGAARPSPIPAAEPPPPLEEEEEEVEEEVEAE